MTKKAMRGDVATPAFEEDGGFARLPQLGKNPAYERTAHAASTTFATNHNVFEQGVSTKIHDDGHAGEFAVALDHGDALVAITKGFAELLLDHAFQSGGPMAEIPGASAP